MSRELTEEDARQSLTAHVTMKGSEIREKYGPCIDWKTLPKILNDRNCVRYPCEIIFDAKSLEAGEFAHPVQKSERPEDGFIIHVHPIYLLQLDVVPYLILYHLVRVNYGDFASADDAEAFASSALGLGKEIYYTTLCELADQLPSTPH